MSKEKMICIAFLLIGTLFLPDAVNGFFNNNMFEGIKYLLISFAVGMIGILYLIPPRKDE